MTLVLLAMTGVSLVLVTNSSISEKAREETYKARVPHRGKLSFASLRAEERTDKVEFEGTNVGREFDYRKYIAGHPTSPQRGIWKFASVPAEMERPQGDRVPVEFTFDVFKMTKGEQNKGVSVNFTFVTHHAPHKQPDKDKGAEWPWVNDDRGREYKARADALRGAGRGARRRPPRRPGVGGGEQAGRGVRVLRVQGQAGVRLRGHGDRNPGRAVPQREQGHAGQGREGPAAAAPVGAT